MLIINIEKERESVEQRKLTFAILEVYIPIPNLPT